MNPARPPRARATLAWIGASLAVLTCATASGQTPPSHPRLLFTGSDIPALQAKVNSGGSPGNAWSLCATSASFEGSGSLPSATGQSSWTVQRTLRRMTELAARYRIAGDSAAGANAKSLLMTAASLLVPTGASAYQLSSYPCAVAITYDLVHPLLSSSERSTVCAHLVSWVSALQSGSNAVGSYSSYSGASDNHSFAWNTGVAMSLMAIWGDTSYTNIVPTIQGAMQRLQSGWNDVWSPDGSCDENIGYLNYGDAYSMLAGLAAVNCGLGDYLQGTNVLKSARWVTASLFGNAFEWVGDSSPSHKGMRLDPVLYLAATRSSDAGALWGLNRLFAQTPVSDSTASQAFSPYLNVALFYPTGFGPQEPALLSGFFRDNLNQGSEAGNKTANFSAVGTGGHALLHNSANSSVAQFGALYMIRDEWMNHSHEDDGHLSVICDGAHHYIDTGYASGNSGAQSTDHNIVTVAGDGGFNGAGNNYFAPPAPNGRYLGRKEALLLGQGADYVRGTHTNMWMMQEATRTVVMVKDPVRPYLILLDRVRKDGSSRTYEENFVAAGPAYGAGTASNPMTVTAAGATLRATWLSPSSVSVVTGAAGSLAGTNFYRNKVTATGTDVTFVSVHARDALSTSTPLPSPLANTAGGTAVWPWASDKILVRKGSGAIGDAQTTSDGAFAWIRSVSGAVSEWMLGEGTSLTHQGQALFTASAPVVASARQGRIEIRGVSPLSSSFTFVATVAFPVSTVTVDGATVSFSQSGNIVSLGQVAPPPPPTAAPGDRVYTFLEGLLGDAVPFGAGYVTPDGRFSSSNGWAGLNLKNGLPFVSRPISLGIDVDFLPGAGSAEAALRIEGSPGANDILNMNVFPAPGNTFRVDVWSGSNLLTGQVIPCDLSGTGGRFNVLYDPAQGTATMRNALGNFLVTVNVAPRTSGFNVKALVTNFAALDNITIFDSEEDGATPQGIAVGVAASGRLFCAVRAPQLIGSSPIAVALQGSWLDPQSLFAWLYVTNFVEVASSAYSTYGSPPPPSLYEVVFQSQNPAVFVTPGSNAAVAFTSATGQLLAGLWAN